jgi:hypothetical protein
MIVGKAATFRGIALNIQRLPASIKIDASQSISNHKSMRRGRPLAGKRESR